MPVVFNMKYITKSRDYSYFCSGLSGQLDGYIRTGCRLVVV